MTVTLLAVGGVGSWWILNTVRGTDAVPTALGTSVLPAAYDPDEAIRSIAVLPLENFSENAEQDYFAAGMHEALIERLSQIPEIRVVSRTTDQTIPEIAQELGVEGVVEGSVFRADD
jgi:TolB-like protein